MADAEDFEERLNALAKIRIEADNRMHRIMAGLVQAMVEEFINCNGEDRDAHVTEVNRTRMRAAIDMLQTLSADEWSNEFPQDQFIAKARLAMTGR